MWRRQRWYTATGEKLTEDNKKNHYCVELGDADTGFVRKQIREGKGMRYAGCRDVLTTWRYLKKKELAVRWKVRG